MNEYKYDIALSLCKQEVSFARELVKTLNPGLKVFFYEDRQEELISECGPEVFAKIFREEARLVVILSRNEWGDSFYTGIEKSAILDRVSNNKKGYNFLMVIPMMPGEKPSWYPFTTIYADPTRFTIEELARFIEFKVADEGGIIEPVTSEDFAKHFISQLEKKKKLIALQNTQLAAEKLQSELDNFKKAFNNKIEYFAQNNYSFIIEHYAFIYCTDDAFFTINNYSLKCSIENPESGSYLRGTQQIKLLIWLEKLVPGSRPEEKTSETYRYYFSENLQGWSIPLPFTVSNHLYATHLFRDVYQEQWYELKNPISTQNLVDKWFTELWTLVKSDFSEIL